MKKNDHVMVQQMLEGSVTLDAFNAFQTRLRAERELAKLYGEYALLNHTLCEEFEGQKWTGKPLLGVGRGFFHDLSDFGGRSGAGHPGAGVP